jgi:hypothetical protein
MKLDHIGDVIVSFLRLNGVVLFGVVVILHLVAVCTLSRHLYFLYLWPVTWPGILSCGGDEVKHKKSFII